MSKGVHKTGNMKIFPNVFVVGAPKCGTTSLYMFFKEHPDVFVPKQKELHFFSFPEVSDTYYEVRFVKILEEYLSYFQGAERFKAAVDVSPSYMFNELAAKRIYNFNPDARIIVLLRNPIDRAISHYLMDRQIGYQLSPLRDFLTKTDENRQYFKEYIEMGFYSNQLHRYIDVFSENQVFVILSDEMQNNENASVAKLCQFLDIREMNLPIERHNAFQGLPRNQWMYRVRKNGMLRRAASFLPSFVKTGFKQVLLDRDSKKPSFEEERAQLSEIYRDDVTNLSDLLHLDLCQLWLK